MGNDVSSVKLSVEDLYDMACLCHAALAQDSPNDKTHYLNQLLNISWAYLPKHYRQKLETYLAEKKYLPDVRIEIAQN